MLSKIVRSNGTEIENIQSVTYSETVNAGESLRPGCVSSAYINVRVYGTNSDAPASGEALTYYQVDPDGNDTLIGVFYAEPSVPSNGMYSFVAYDAVRKLDTDFSAKLESMQSSFPMTVYDLVSEACSVAGVTLGSASWPMSTMSVNAFYADKLTCRNILQYAAEIACRFVRCDVNGNVKFDWYTTNTDWSIYPGGSDADKVAYRLGGLSYDGNNVQSIDSVVIKSVGEYGTQYTYPEYNPDISAIDPDSDGNVTMLNVTVTDSGDGHLTIIAKADDPNRDGNVTIEDGASAENSLTIANNLLLTDATEATYVSVAQNILSAMIALPTYRFAEIQLFPNENPFRSGEFVSVTDVQGISFITPVFTMTLSSSGATLRSSGTNVYRPSETTTTEKEIASQTNELVRINKLKVDWAEIVTAIVETLEAHGIDADWINAGTLTVKDENDKILFQADLSSNSVRLGLWNVSENSLTPTDSTRDSYISASILRSNMNVIWTWLNGKAIISEGDSFQFADGITFNGPIPYWTSTDGILNGLNIPRTIWENSDPSQSMAAQTLTLKTPASAYEPVTDMSLFNCFFVEIAYTTSVQTRKSGTWVYVGDGETIVATPSVAEPSAFAYVFRDITISRSSNSISIATGKKAASGGVVSNTSYAIPTRIMACKI